MIDIQQRIKNKMVSEHLPEQVITTFLTYYNKLVHGHTGYIHESEINGIKKGTLPEYDAISSYRTVGENALQQVAIIKLNGGLGTSMGLNGPKCLLPAKKGYSFIDIAIQQIIALNTKYSMKIPLILMNSFNTHAETVVLLDKYPEIHTTVPLTFMQHKYPKILQETLEPAVYPEDPQHEWNPPGHGDIYTALITSGILKKLLDAGITYAFVSNIDNLGATMDTALLGYCVHHAIPFLMEVVERTEMDKKGGHLAQLKDTKRFVLRERAQVAPHDIEQFEDIERHHYFNSNNIWINCAYIQKLFADPTIPFGLPLIVNKKHIIPSDKNSPSVYQLETAMGAAIGQFDNSRAVHIPLTRFKPVKKCNDLLVLWSDYYILSDSMELQTNPARTLPPIDIELDEKYYGTYDQMEARFPDGVPSLVDCQSLVIQGDILFGKNIRIIGNVTITNTSKTQIKIPDNLIVDKDLRY